MSTEPSNINEKISEKAPLQKRSRKTRRRILAAARDLIAEIGFEDTTTTLIAERAGVSIGGLYARFDTKWQIFHVIQDEHARATYEFLKAAIGRALEGEPDPARDLAALILGLYETHKLHGKLNFEIARFIIMNEQARANDRRWEEMEDRELERYLRHYLPHEGPEAVRAAAVILHRAAHEVFYYMYDRQGELDEELFLAQFTRMVHRFIAG